MAHEEADLLLVGLVEVGPVDACEVLREVGEVVPIALKRRASDSGMVAFDRLADQLLVGESHS